MIRRICFGMLVALAMLTPIRTKAAPRSQRANKSATCPVSLRRKDTPPSGGGNFFEPETSDWKPTLSVGLWPDGTVVFQPGATRDYRTGWLVKHEVPVVERSRTPR